MAEQTFYFSDGPYLQAMHGLHAALCGSEAFVKFIGKAHTGKSSVCEKLSQFLRHKDYRVIYFDYAIESPDMLRAMLAKELGVPDTFNFHRQLEDVCRTETDKPIIIIFDDAHLLSDITLVEIYRLAEVQVAQKRIINIALCGEPELEKRLSGKREFKSLLHNVSHNFVLGPMDSEITARFFHACMQEMQREGLQLEPAALSQFYKVCKGFPGPAYSLCQLLLSSRESVEELHPLSKEELLALIKGANNEKPMPSSGYQEANRWLLMGPLAAVLVIMSLALLLKQLAAPEDDEASNVDADLPIEQQVLAAGNESQPSPFVVDKLD